MRILQLLLLSLFSPNSAFRNLEEFRILGESGKRYDTPLLSRREKRELTRLVVQYNDLQGKERFRRDLGELDVVRDPESVTAILHEMMSARSLGEIGRSVTQLIRVFHYGSWCGLGHSQIDVQSTCCNCQPQTDFHHGFLMEVVDTCNNCSLGPMDSMDLACQVHDICYSCFPSILGSLFAMCECEKAISDLAQRAECDVHPENSLVHRWCEFFKKAVPFVFGLKPCLCSIDGRLKIKGNFKQCEIEELIEQLVVAGLPV